MESETIPTIKSLSEEKGFGMNKIGDLIRLTWGFETFLEKFILVALLLLGLWKLFDLGIKFFFS